MNLPPLVAVTLGPLVAGVVWKARLLSARGAIAAAALGSAAALAGWDWMALLLAFFGSSVVLSRIGREKKRVRSAAVIEKSGARDATQVLANGAVFGAGALLSRSIAHNHAVALIALGALAAAAADTWGTELGMLSRGAPRSILTGKTLEPGMSGGVSFFGLFATVSGASTIALLAYLLHWPGTVAMCAGIGGVIGALTDSLLGASMQHRRKSLATGRMTERMTDDDGTPTTSAGGAMWLNNDGVNFAATLTGAISSLVCAHLLVAYHSL